ncbi:MAG: hypothetical protein QW478_12600 [Candidatus Micrarchaeaceae archaeon]
MFISKIYNDSMGQYFTLVNLDKKEYVSPWDINGGAKLWEWMANLDECGVIFALILDRWSNDKITLVGDYDESKLYDKVYNEKQKYKNISSTAQSLFKKVFDTITLSADATVSTTKPFSNKKFNVSKDVASYAEPKNEKVKTKYYLINTDTNEYVTGTIKQLSICLPLLIRQSNESGGGDIQEDYKSAGLFSQHRLKITEQEPEKGKNITPLVFNEAFDFYKT